MIRGEHLSRHVCLRVSQLAGSDVGWWIEWTGWVGYMWCLWFDRGGTGKQSVGAPRAVRINTHHSPPFNPALTVYLEHFVVEHIPAS